MSDSNVQTVVAKINMWRERLVDTQLTCRIDNWSVLGCVIFHLKKMY